MNDRTSIEDTGFHLKRIGQFEAALHKYLERYIHAFQKNYLYIQELSFEQMIDILLMTYVRDRRTFGSVDEVMEQLEADVRHRLIEANAYRPETVQHFLGKCREKFAPRGRRPGLFSVDKDALIDRRTPRVQRKAV